jgi:hypothetical protein
MPATIPWNGVARGTTQSGIPFSIQQDGYSEQFENSASQITADLICDWESAGDFRNDMVGYTTWDGTSAYLNRQTPYLNPQSNQRYGHRCDLVGKGGPRTAQWGGDGSGGDSTGWLDLMFAKYKVTFRRRPYTILPDDAGFSAGTLKEYQRYTNTELQFTTRERIIPGLQLKTLNGNAKIPSQGFYPDRTVQIIATWYEVPLAAIPFQFLSRATNLVNNVAFRLPFGDTTLPMYFEAWSLLLKGVAGSLKPYETATGDLAVDLRYHLDLRPTVPVTAQPGNAQYYQGGALSPSPGVGGNWWGWNGVPIPGTANNWDQLVDAETGTKPPYTSIDLQQLWVPGAG